MVRMERGEESHQQRGHKDDEKERRDQNTYVGGASSTISMACTWRLGTHMPTTLRNFPGLRGSTSTILLFRESGHPLFNTMYTRFLVIIGLLVGASAGSLRTHDKPLDKLSDEELGVRNGDLTPTLLKKYKKRVTQLKASLDSLIWTMSVFFV